MPKHDAYLWEAHIANPPIIIQQERGGWKQLERYKYQCEALIFRPQREAFRQVSFDFRPELGFVLQWVGWENSVSFCGPRLVGHSATNKIVVRQFFEPAVEEGETRKQWFEFFYYMLPDGNIVMGNMDFDPMLVKMKGFVHASSNSQLRPRVVR